MTTLPKVKLPGGKTITLNSQQAEALDLMKAWIEDPNALYFTLSGYAGTGKTTIMNELVKYFNKRQDSHNKNTKIWERVRGICVSAPTHKAKKVIARATGIDAYTIQKLLGLRPNTELETFDINNPQFDEMAEKEIASHALVIIDEASMLNSSLFDLLLLEAEEAKTKILFMGDEAQLPPVGESISRIFTHVTNSVRLTKVERQADGNPLMEVYDRIRGDIKSSADQFSHISNVNAKGEGIQFHTEQSKFEAEVLPLFASEEYRKDPDLIKLLTYMNASVRIWNTQIRNHVFGDDAKEPLLQGEILFAYNTVVKDFTDIMIENSADYRVDSIEPKTIEGIDVYYTRLRSVDENRLSFVNIVRKSGLPKFIQKFTFLLSTAKVAVGQKRGIAWKRYYQFKNNNLLLQDIKESSGKLLVKKDLDYGYAITVHKSQGSTFTNVAVSETNIDRNPNTEERNKLKYVAFSRPTNKAIVFTNKTE